MARFEVVHKPDGIVQATYEADFQERRELYPGESFAWFYRWEPGGPKQYIGPPVKLTNDVEIRVAA